MKILSVILTLLCSMPIWAQSTGIWRFDTTQPLLGKGQISSNACSKSCDSAEDNLVDGNAETYYHSSWSTANGSPLPNAKHYLQWHLKEAEQHIFFQMTGMNWASAHNTPHCVTLLATNTPGDESSWVEVASLENMIATPNVYPAHYTSGHIDAKKAYSDWRMVVNKTTTGNVESTYGQQFFCLAEFQVYQAIEVTDGKWAPLLGKGQISTNACAKNCDSAEDNLVDGNEATYFHSSWSTANGSKLPNAKHYLQWHLNEAKQAIIFKMVGMDWPSAHNTPHNVTILATNTPSDEASWVKVTDLENMIDVPDFYPARYTSDKIEASEPYTDWRMVVNGTTTGSKETTYGQYFFCLSEFQVYEYFDGMIVEEPKVSDLALNLVFIGNSITYGATLSNPALEAPPVQVAGMLNTQTGRPVFMTNCGVSGSTTLNWLPGTSYYNRAAAAAQLYKKHGGQIIFSMMLGTNDSAESGPTGSPVSTSDYEKNVKRIIDALMQSFPDAIFLLNYPIWYSPTTQNGAVYLQAGLDRLISYHPIIDKVVADYQAQGKKVYAGDKGAFNFFENNNKYFTSEHGAKGTFYLHPNAEGAIKLAEFWTKSIKQIVDPQSTSDRRQKDIELLDSAMVLAGKMFSLATETEKLIVNAQDGEPGCQLSSNASDGAEGSFANLIDGKPATYFQSTRDDLGFDQFPVLDIDLQRDDVNLFCIKMSRQTQKTAVGYNQMPSDITVYTRATEDEPWAFVRHLKDGFPAKTSSMFYLSPMIYGGKTFRYVRLQFNKNQTLALSDGGMPYINIGELQLLSRQIVKENSDYYALEGVDEATDDLCALCATLSVVLQDKEASLSSEQIQQLQDAIQRLYDTKEEATALTELPADLPSLSNKAYNLKGQRVAPDAKGIILKDGKKYLHP